MRNLLFKDRTRNSGSSLISSWFGVSTREPFDGFLSERDFQHSLSLEVKRAERSHKSLLLMLLDTRKLLESAAYRVVLSNILSTLSSFTRETDMRGWYQEGSVIGIVFTEIDTSEKMLAEKAVHERITERLGASLSDSYSKQIAITLRFLPESWTSGTEVDSGNGDPHLGPLTAPDSKKASRLLKRVIDVVGSLSAVVVLSPIFAAVAVLIKLTSEGPVFFRQRRVGWQGRPFECLKFRSMHVANDASVHREFVRKLIAGKMTCNSDNGKALAEFKLKDDPRVTALGRVLRKTSLDEIPQFWNVLKGEMSLVGPRPAIPYEIAYYDTWHRRRVLNVKPGITGLWQVCGRSRTTFDEMVRLDIRYATSWSIWLDLKILIRTPGVVLSGNGAY